MPKSTGTGPPRQEDSTRLAFAALPHRLVEDVRLSPTDVRVAAALLFWARGKAVCWPGDKAIAARVDRSAGTVQRSLRKLEVAGWIARERTEANRTGRLIRLTWRISAADRQRSSRTAPALDPPRSPARDEEDVIVKGDLRKETPINPDLAPRQRSGEPPDRCGEVPHPQSISPVVVQSLPAPLPSPAPTISAGTVLSAAEADRLQDLAPGVRDRVLNWVASGDPILLSEARRCLGPPAPPKAPPATLLELLGRLREDPANVPAAAAALCQAFDDPKSYSGFLARVGEAFEGRRDPADLVEALKQASGPKARNRGAIFMTVCGRIRE